MALASRKTRLDVRDGDRPTIAVSGPMDLRCAAELSTVIRGLLSESDKVELDLSDADYIDSRCMSVLVNAHNSASLQGKTLNLLACSPPIERALQFSGLGEPFGLPSKTKSDAATVETRPLCRGDEDWRIYESVAKSDCDLVKELRDIAVEAAVECGMSAEEIQDVELAVGEALTNAYRHGSPRRCENNIRLRCLTRSDTFVAEVTDEGAPFNPSMSSMPNARKLQSGGLGLFLMRATMDEVEISNEGRGNRVRMVKRLGVGKKIARPH